MNYNIIMDLQKDWLQHIENIFKSNGISIDMNDSPKSICDNYFNFKKRMVKPVSRSILVSEEFLCPNDCEKGLSIVEDKIKNGIDLFPHLSRRIFEPDFNDVLLNDWGIYHLHLGTKLEPSGLVKGKNFVLFVRFDEKHAYFIAVGPHNKWADKKLIEILLNNWPSSIEKHKIQNANHTKHNLTEKDIEKHRYAGSLIPFEAESGTIYSLLGGGYTTSRKSIDVICKSDFILELLENCENFIKDKIDEFAEHVKKKVGVIPQFFEFSLLVSENKLLALEKNFKIALELCEYD